MQQHRHYLNPKSNHYLLVPLLWVVLYACAPKKQAESQSTDYLGQETPDTIPQIFGKDIISVDGRFDMGFAMSPNGKSMVFGVADETDPKGTCLYLMNNIDGIWSSPDKSFLPDNVNTFFPMFGPSGDKLYFAKSNGSDTDLWSAEFVDHSAIAPQPLDSIFNSKSREAGHGKAKSGAFYFTSNRDDQNQCCGDIYYAKPTSGRYTNIQRSAMLSSEADEESLFLSPNGRYIIVQAWKGEFQSKHDLYISYRTIHGSWTPLKRLNDHINGKEIEQRPFVSPDHKFLFFSRMKILRENGRDSYDSDIYWVSTKSVFAPYIYNPQIEASVTFNKKFELHFPSDLFKDIDNQELTYQLTLKDGSEIPEWITFDSDKLMLSGTWATKEPLGFKLTARDGSGNSNIFKFDLNQSNLETQD